MAVNDKDKDRKRGDELDAFWDIESLLPSSGRGRGRNARVPTPAERRKVTPSAVDVELTPQTPPAGDAEPVRPSTLSLFPDGTWKGGPLSPSGARAPQNSARPEQKHDAPAEPGHPSDDPVDLFDDLRVPASPPGRADKADATCPRTAASSPRPGNVITGEGPLQDAGIGVTHYVPPHTPDDPAAEKPVAEYTPDGLLLHVVRIFEWHSNYRYFDQFTQDAVRFDRLEPLPGGEERREPFFSYFPQYAQLTRRQTAWYLRWRAQIRKHTFPETDYAYILLFIFEQINLPATPDEAAARRDLMADVWMAYRKRFPQLDHYMCEWLCDYCLIHRLNAPADRLAPALDEVINLSRLKEFYLSSVITVSGDGRDMETARILLRHCCQYDYRKSKFAAGEHKELFDKTVPAAVAAVLPKLFEREKETPLLSLNRNTVTRDAFTGALCGYTNKRRIEVTFTSFSRSHEMRFLVGDMVKHVENRLRAWIGVRSRLSVMSLPVPIRNALDEWLNPRAPARTIPAGKKPEARPDYEKLYDLPAAPVSLAHADEIERTSWETTRRLTEAFGEGEPEETITAPPLPETPPAPPSEPVPVPPRDASPLPPSVPAASAGADDSLAAALGDLCAFVRLALDKDYAGQRAYAKAARRLPDALADAVNDATAASEIGDVILEDRGDGTYDVIEDYRDSLEALLG